MNAFALTRRNLIAGLAAATAFATVPVAGAASPTENPELLSLADDLSAAIAEASQSQADYSQCLETWGPNWPAPPEDIRTRYNFGEVARTLSNKPIYDENEKAIRIATVAELDEDIASIRMAMARKRRDPSKPFFAYTKATTCGLRLSLSEWAIEVDQLSDLRQIAAVYEADQSRIRAASGFVEKADRREGALQRLKVAISEVMARRPVTVEGLLIQAQAMEAAGHLDPWQKATAAMTTNWGADFAVSLIRISSAG
jgi:hypothetical protein